MNIKNNFEEFLKGRKIALLSDDVEVLKNYFKKYNIPIPEEMDVFWHGIHLARIFANEVPKEMKIDSALWLKNHLKGEGGYLDFAGRDIIEKLIEDEEENINGIFRCAIPIQLMQHSTGVIQFNMNIQKEDVERLKKYLDQEMDNNSDSIPITFMRFGILANITKNYFDQII